jgi:hypothetical protein
VGDFFNAKFNLNHKQFQVSKEESTNLFDEAIFSSFVQQIYLPLLSKISSINKLIFAFRLNTNSTNVFTN